MNVCFYILNDYLGKLNNFYSSRLERLEEIQSLEFKERFSAIKEDFGFAPMLAIKEFLLHNTLLRDYNGNTYICKSTNK